MFFSLLATIAVCVGCESSTTSEVTTGPTPDKCQLTLAPPPNIVATGGSAAVSITAQPECAWTVSTQANWISNVAPTSGQGAGKVEFVAAENPAPTMREGEIVVNDNRIRVMQEAAPCRYAIDPDRRTASADAGNGSFTVATHEACKWTARSNVEWLTITSGGAGAGNDTVAYRLAANGGGVRIGTITIGERTHTVTQQERASTPTPPTPPPPPTPEPPTPPDCTYTINPMSQAIAAGGGAGQVTVATTGTCAWTAASNDGWLTVTSGAAGAGNGTVGFTAASNGGAARSGTLTIAGRTFTVSQAAAAPPPPAPSCTYQINPTSASLPVLGGTGSFSISTGSGCAWTATNSASWISFTTATSGTGNGTIGFLVLPNIGSARSSVIAIAGLSFTVSQDAVLPSQ